MQMRDEHARPVLRVVVAEDERPARELLACALAMRQDVDLIAEVHDGLSLCDALVREDVDVVFLDEGLPNRSFADDHLGPAGPLLVLTSTEAIPQQRAVSPLMLPKPFSSAELDAVLNAARAGVVARVASRTLESPMWNVSSTPKAAAPDAPPAGRSKMWRGIVGFALLWIVLYLLVLAPPGAAGRDAVITGKAVDDAMQSHVRLSFSSLSGFEYHPGMSKSDLPADVRRADGREVAIYGYMLPIDVSGDGVSRFLLNASYDMCMFGMTAGGPHQWVAVEMADGRRAPFTHMPMVVFGRLDICEQRQNGRVMSMYRLRADKVAVYDR
jgi:hypothetical protein